MKKVITLLNESVIIDTIFLYEFLKRLTTPFNRTKAFELGIIDENGTILKKRSTLRTSAEKNAFTMFDLLVRNLKRIIEKFPFGKSKIASYAAALFLIKEHKYLDFYANNQQLLQETFTDFFDSINIDISSKCCIMELMEQPIVNVVGAGHIAGVSPGEQPAVHLKKRRILRRKKRNENTKECPEATPEPESTESCRRKRFSEFAKLDTRN